MLRAGRGFGAPAGRVPRWLAGVLACIVSAPVVLAHAQPADPAPACSPPALVDLQLERTDPPGQPAWAGSTGSLTFKVSRRTGSNFSRPFGISHALHPLPHGGQQTLRLESLGSSQCWSNELIGPGPIPGLYGLYYYLEGTLGPTPESTATCRLRYDVLPAARMPEWIRFSVFPVGCAIDPAMADNHIDFAFGGPAPAVPVPGPGRAWLWLAAALLLAVAFFTVGAGRLRPRRRAVLVARVPPATDRPGREPSG